MTARMMLLIDGRASSAGLSLTAPWNAPHALTVDTYDGSGAVIHPSVVDMGDEGWNGYRYWLADSPYADADAQLENPCIWAGNDPEIFIVPDGVVNPLSPAPGAGIGFHSDQELVWDPEGQRMVMYYRRTYFNLPDGPATIFVHALTSTDGITWIERGPLFEVSLTGGRLSPAVVRTGPGEWRMWLWGADQSTCTTLTATDPLGPWSGHTPTALDAGTLIGWHGDVIWHEGLFYMLYSDNIHSKFLAATSSDGIDWSAPLQPVLMEQRKGEWDDRIYRPTLALDPEPGVFRMWYSAISPSSPGGHAIGFTRIPISAWA